MPEKIRTLKRDISADSLAVCFYFLCMPFTIVSTPLGSLLRLVTVPVIAVLFCKLFVGSRKMLCFNGVHLLYSLYIVYTLLSLFIYRGEEATSHIQMMLLACVTMLLMTVRVYNRREQHLIEDVWIIVGIICTVLCLTSKTVLNTIENRTVISIFGYAEDPNQFCAYFIMPIVVCVKRISEKSRFYPLYAANLVLIFYAILKTGSRGGLIGAAGALLACVFLGRGSASSKIKLALSLAVCAVLVVTVVFPRLPEDVQERYSAQDVIETRGTGRFDIWVCLVEYTTENYERMICGSGLLSTYEILEDKFATARVAHNQFVQVFSDQGIIGLTLYLAFCAVCVLRNIRKEPYYSSAFIAMMAMSMSLTMYTFKPYTNIIIMSAMIFEGGTGKNSAGKEQESID